MAEHDAATVVQVLVRKADGTTETRVVEAERFEVGRWPAPGGLVLDDDKVSRRHLTVIAQGRALAVVDANSTNGTRVDGWPLERERRYPVSDLARVEVGDTTLTFRPGRPPFERTAAAAPGEADFARALRERPRDAQVRLVYADWLEERGHAERAELLRAQAALAELGPEPAGGFDAEAKRAVGAATARVREAAARVDQHFRALASVPAVEKCELAFSLPCPRRWDALSATAQDDVRRCDVCRKDVFYCDTVEQARALAERGACVAVDVTALRTPRDLEPRRELVMGMVA